MDSTSGGWTEGSPKVRQQLRAGALARPAAPLVETRPGLGRGGEGCAVPGNAWGSGGSSACAEPWPRPETPCAVPVKLGAQGGLGTGPLIAQRGSGPGKPSSGKGAGRPSGILGVLTPAFQGATRGPRSGPRLTGRNRTRPRSLEARRALLPGLTSARPVSACPQPSATGTCSSSSPPVPRS